MGWNPRTGTVYNSIFQELIYEKNLRCSCMFTEENKRELFIGSEYIEDVFFKNSSYWIKHE